jgi:single-strand DNA-binding protein
MGDERDQMNKVIIVGRLTRDPEVRYTQTGKAVTSFSVAVDTGFGDKKRTDFVPVISWEKLAEACGNNLTKGRRVLVEGRLQIRNYEKDGEKRLSADVVAQNVEFLDGKQSSSTTAPSEGGYDVSSFGSEVFPEEEIPF